jgi:DDE family transposase
MRGVLEALAEDLRIRGRLDVRESFIDGSFCSRQKGGSKVGKTKRGKGSKIMAAADRHGLPVAVCVESATPHEVKLPTATLARMIVPEAPENLIGDNAYDSDKLDAELRRYGIELIAPHRINRRNTTQDLRRLQRYRRRWKI